MSHYDWSAEFKRVYHEGAARYRAGQTSQGKMFGEENLEFLRSIGCSAQELFDFIEDGVRYGEPSYEDALLVTSVRREYFIHVLKGQSGGPVAEMSSLPAKSAAVDGIAWLPRLIVKARLKLLGTMPDDLMYGCGGDRPFLRRMNVPLADFLRVVWANWDNVGAVIDFFKKKAADLEKK